MNYLPLHLCKTEYGMERVYKHKFIKFELVLMYSVYAIFQFAKIATVSYFICYTETLLKKIEIHSGRQEEPADFSWIARLFYKLHKKVFPKYVHSPGIPVLYQLYWHGRKLATKALVLSARSVRTCSPARPNPWLLLVQIIYQFHFTSVTRNSTSIHKSEVDVALILPLFFPSVRRSFTGILSYLKLNKKEIRRNKDLRPHLVIKLGTCRIKDHATLKKADCVKSFLLETLADLKRDLPLTLTKIL